MNLRDLWTTPAPVVAYAAHRYAGGGFDLDVAASSINAKAPHFYDARADGLAQPWFGRVWCNPPYSSIEPWVRRAAETVEDGSASVVVMLVPARTDLRWWAHAVARAWKVEHIRGRIKFIAPPGLRVGRDEAPKERSAFLVFRRGVDVADMGIAA